MGLLGRFWKSDDAKAGETANKLRDIRVSSLI